MTSSLPQRRTPSRNYIIGLPETPVFQVQEMAITFNGKLSLSDWESLGKHLLAFTESVTWWIADWLVYGEETYKDRYQEAIRRTSLSYQTLRNYTWVAKRINSDRRRPSLSFGHHAEVASLDCAEQDFWLRKAEEFGWSRNQLRSEVRTSLSERNGVERNGVRGPGDNSAGEDDPWPAHQEGVDSDSEETKADALRIQLTSGQLEKCEAVAKKSGMSVVGWAAQVLLTAASQPPSVNWFRVPNDGC